MNSNVDLPKLVGKVQSSLEGLRKTAKPTLPVVLDGAS